MKLLTRIIEKYLNTKYEDFSEKLADAIAIMNLIIPDIKDKKLIIDARKDLETINFISNNTSKEIMVDFKKLDRCVNPTKGEFQRIDNKRVFYKNTNEVTELGNIKKVTLYESSIHKLLYDQIIIINNIIMKWIKDYSFEMPITRPSDATDENKDVFDNI